MKYILSILLSFLFLGCSQAHPPLKTVERVEIEKYLGVWYEIARYEHFFEKGCSDVNATYSLRDDGEIDVLNSCTKEGEITTAKGVAYATDESNSKLKVSFFRPFYGDYQILMLGKNYEYAVIGEPSREYFWILSRSKKLDEQSTQKILSTMPSLGYDAKELIWTPQS